MSKTLSVLVEDEPRVLARIAGLFGQRGFNIDSIVVGKSEFAGLSRMTIVVGKGQETELVIKQLNKLINVIKVTEHEDKTTLKRELCLFKVAVTKETRQEIQDICDNFRAKIVDVSLNSLVVEVTGTEEKIEVLESILTHFGIQEVVRTGAVAMSRGINTNHIQKGDVNYGKNVL